jgi:hypothetical protein
MVNAHYAVMLADRRITESHVVADDESNKLAILRTADARVAVGYTGIARYGSFHTHQWTLEALMTAAKPDFRFAPMLDRFASLATEHFQSLALERSKKRLTVVFAGFDYSYQPPLGLVAYVSNFQNDVTAPGVLQPVANETFVPVVIYETRPHQTAEPFFALRAFGSTQVPKREDSGPLQQMLRENRPSTAVRDAALHVFDRIAAGQGVSGPVGRQCGSIIIPADPSLASQSDYHSGLSTWEVELPSRVDVTGSPNDGAVMGIRLRADQPSIAPPLAVRKVPRNQPCPCGSGEKYKYCHGRVMPQR